MDTWLLGYCSRCPDGVRTGRIVVMSSLRKNVHGEFLVDRPASELTDDIGRSGCVFWPQNPPSAHDLCGSLVRFQCDEGPEYGDPTTTKDWMRVARGASGWEVHRIGFRIVDQGPDAQWRQEPRWAKGLPEGERIFVRQRATSTLVGPWRVGRELEELSNCRELLPHPNPSKVFEYAVKDLDPVSICDGVFPIQVPRIELLLYAPDEARGQPVDLATPKQLAKWVVERMVAVAPQAVVKFDKETPGWRSRLRDEIEGYGEAERHVFRSRWERLEGSLTDLAFEAESVEKLLQHPRFLARVDELVKTQVDAKVAARAGEIETEAQRKAKSTVERLEKEIQAVNQQHREAADRRDHVTRDLQAKLDALGERQRVVNELVS